MPATRETLTSLAVPSERTRFYSRLRTLRIAHGLTECLRDVVTAMDDGPVSLWFDRVDEAEHLDREFLGALLRRLDPALVTPPSKPNGCASRRREAYFAAVAARHAEGSRRAAPVSRALDAAG